MASESDIQIVNLCLVGSGRIGKVHLVNIISNPQLNLRYVVDVDLAGAQQAAKRAGNGCKAVATLEEALQDPSVHAVMICTPTPSHTELILTAIRARKAVMCEKPVALKVEDIDTCFKEAEKYGVPLLCAFHRRFDPSFAKVKDAVHAGKIGKVHIIKTVSRDSPLPSIAYLKISGGIFHDCGSHDIDLSRWITGEDPIEVFTAASAFRSEIAAIHDYDTVLMTFRYPSGIVGSVDLSRRAAYGYDQRVEVFGDGGMAQAENVEQSTTILSTENGVTHDNPCYSFPTRYVAAYSNELQHFVQVALGKEKPRLSHEDCRKAAIIGDAAELSAREGRPVRITYN